MNSQNFTSTLGFKTLIWPFQGYRPKYSTTDHWIQEYVKRIFNSGCREKNPNCHKYATFEVSFFIFSWPKKHLKNFILPWKHKKTDLKSGIFFFSAAQTAKNNPELNIQFIDSCIQWSVVPYLGCYQIINFLTFPAFF